MNKYVTPSLELVKFSPVSVIATSGSEETTTTTASNAPLTPPTAGGTGDGSLDG